MKMALKMAMTAPPPPSVNWLYVGLGIGGGVLLIVLLIILLIVL